VRWTCLLLSIWSATSQIANAQNKRRVLIFITSGAALDNPHWGMHSGIPWPQSPAHIHTHTHSRSSRTPPLGERTRTFTKFSYLRRRCWLLATSSTADLTSNANANWRFLWPRSHRQVYIYIFVYLYTILIIAALSRLCAQLWGFTSFKSHLGAPNQLIRYWHLMIDLHCHQHSSPQHSYYCDQVTVLYCAALN
jgi:hypothetical protein